MTDSSGTRSIYDFRPVLLVIGVLLATLGCAMMLPAMYDLAMGHDDWQIFAASSLITLFVGTSLAFANRGRTENLTIRQAFLMTNLAWIALTAFGALPFAWSSEKVGYTDAFFETMSGITTTGATVLQGLDALPPGLLLWRGILQWLGGLGIIVMAVALLPILQIGGMQMFRVEAFDTAGKVLPRATQIAGSLTAFYVAATATCAIAYALAGMSTFDAIVHSMTTIATGGYSNHDASFAYFDSAMIEIVCIVFMCVGSLPFVLYLKAISTGDIRCLTADSQVRWFFGAITLFTTIAVISYEANIPEPGGSKTLDALFNVVSILTGTGYATTAYDLWSPLAMVLFFLMMFVGGCTGSTSCGLKIFRFQVMFETIRCRVRHVIYPKGVFVERYNGKPIPDTVINAVMGLFLLFMTVFAVSATLLSIVGLDSLTAISAAATAVSNVGPGLGPVVGPAGNFSTLPDSAKWILSATMLLGRLEIFTVLVLFTPAFWRA
ncbi:MAG: TrkH family potassium uptake protein [Hyphomicrobiales bacterium]